MHLLIALLLLASLALWLYRRKPRLRVVKGGKGKLIALTSQTSEGKVRRKILANLRRSYPGQSEEWYQRQADERLNQCLPHLNPGLRD